MKIGVYPADTTGCGHYRLIWPAQVLRDQGVDVDIIWPSERGAKFRAVLEDGVVTHVDGIGDYDVVVFQRVTHRYLAQAIPQIRRQGIAVVVDIDDDLENIHPANPAFTVYHPTKIVDQRTVDHSWKWARQAIENATLITVTTPALVQRYARGREHAVIPNYVPERFLQTPHVDSTVFGWGGSLHSHPTDPDVLGATVPRLIDDGFKFKIVGPGIRVRLAFRVRDDQEVEITNAVPQTHWVNHLASLGVGIAPLEASAFNRAKSWLKPLEYAAAGVPCVMSPRDDYRRIHNLGIGVLAEKPRDWYRQLKKLLTDNEWRQNLGVASREVANTLTIEKNVTKWAEAWLHAFDVQSRDLQPASD